MTSGQYPEIFEKSRRPFAGAAAGGHRGTGSPARGLSPVGKGGGSLAVHLAGADLYLDCYQEAEAHADRSMAVGLATGQSELVPLAYPILGQVKLLRGQLKSTWRSAQKTVKLTDGLDQSLVCAAGVAMATALLESGTQVEPSTSSSGLPAANSSCSSGRVESQVPGAADPLLARARPPR